MVSSKTPKLPCRRGNIVMTRFIPERLTETGIESFLVFRGHQLIGWCLRHPVTKFCDFRWKSGDELYQVDVDSLGIAVE